MKRGVPLLLSSHETKRSAETGLGLVRFVRNEVWKFDEFEARTRRKGVEEWEELFFFLVKWISHAGLGVDNEYQGAHAKWLSYQGEEREKVNWNTACACGKFTRILVLNLDNRTKVRARLAAVTGEEGGKLFKIFPDKSEPVVPKGVASSLPCEWNTLTN